MTAPWAPLRLQAHDAHAMPVWLTPRQERDHAAARPAAPGPSSSQAVRHVHHADGRKNARRRTGSDHGTPRCTPGHRLRTWEPASSQVRRGVAPPEEYTPYVPSRTRACAPGLPGGRDGGALGAVTGQGAGAHRAGPSDRTVWRCAPVSP